MKTHSVASEHLLRTDVLGTGADGSHWGPLFRVGAWGAFFAATMTVLGVVTFLIWPPPVGEVVEVWFAEFNRNWLVGMLGLDLLILLAYVALLPTVLALYVALRRENASLMLLGAVLGLIAITTYFASARIFEMLALSQQYAAATTEAERALLVAAGQSMLTTYLGAASMPTELVSWNYQGTAFNISFVLWAIAGLLISVVMLKAPAFGRVVGTAGIAGNLLVFGIFVPVVGVLLSLLSLPVLLVWYSLIGRSLIRLARQSGDLHPPHSASREAMLEDS